jgi:hypothetical protein
VNDYVRSLLRFWWVIVIGLAVAVAGGILTVYNVDFSTSPPSLTERTKPNYSAQGRLLVTDAGQPHLRNSVTNLQAVSADANGTPRLLPVTSAPDTATLVQAANLYPSFIESDPVAEIREDIYGPNDGRIRAQALYAVSSPSRFVPSRVPVIQLIAVADTPKKAIDLVTHTTDAFIRWMTQSQQEAGIKPKQRITVVPLQTPKSAAAFGGASSTLPVLVFGVVLMAFVALALLFDKMFPRRREEVAPAAETAREPARTSA